MQKKKEITQLTLTELVRYRERRERENEKMNGKRVEPFFFLSVHGLKSIELRSKSDSAAISRATCAESE